MLPENFEETWNEMPIVTLNEQYGRLISYALPCPHISPRQFLAHSRGLPRFYWESGHDAIALAGCGVAVELVAYQDRFTHIEAQARELFSNAVFASGAGIAPPFAKPRLFGGFSFRDDFIPDEAWADFVPAQFILPHYQLLKMGDECWLTINTQISDDETPRQLMADLHTALLAKLDDLAKPLPPLPDAPPISDLRYPMPYDLWEANLTSAINQMKAGMLKKVVLSRVAEARFDAPIDVDRALDFLAGKYPETTRFLFEPRPHHAFYGATPELLAHVDDFKIRTMALAGSIRRGKTADETTQLAGDLLNSTKDRYEHQLVLDKLKERLIPLTHTLDIGETGVMPLSNIQHLHTPINGELRQTIGILPIIEALHPTPALGGDPQDIAMALIRDLEPVPRGWFASPIGWIDGALNGQFVVGIRSGVTQHDRAWLYAGAGIVADSDPRKEWDETALKFRPMMGALGIES
jgi:menaquinone-specific isochorismate synthase